MHICSIVRIIFHYENNILSILYIPLNVVCTSFNQWRLKTKTNLLSCILNFCSSLNQNLMFTVCFVMTHSYHYEH